MKATATIAMALLLQAAPPPTPAAPKLSSTDLSVSVIYKGKGAVDAAHPVYVWLFDDANITSGSRPYKSSQSVTKNGGTVTFTGVTSSPVFVFAVYNEGGTYDGVSGPPPAGLPASPYRTAAQGPAAPVKPGTALKLTFDDSERWNK